MGVDGSSLFSPRGAYPFLCVWRRVRGKGSGRLAAVAGDRWSHAFFVRRPELGSGLNRRRNWGDGPRWGP